ncbi:MAG TPA: hypothetical protein DDZ89_09330, partial [Clostridiales bacterium]|nr:hypothetical protein [Clostridiales bacterium]
DKYRKQKDFEKLRFYIGVNEEIEEYIKTIDNLLDIFNNANTNSVNNGSVEEIDIHTDGKDAENDTDTEVRKTLSESFGPFPLVQKINLDSVKDIKLVTPKKQPDLTICEPESHSLYESFLHKKPCGFKIDEKLIRADTWQKMLVKTCEYLFYKDEKLFLSLEHKEHMNGSSKKYFSSNPDDMTKRAKMIGGKMYVELNQGANLIRNLVKRLLKEYGMSVVDYRVYYSDVKHLIEA